MTAKATKKPPAEVGENEFKRYTPEEVAEKRFLPYTARVLREKCYRRELIHHKDGGRITFTAQDIRENSARAVVRPISETKPARSAA